MPNTPQDDRLNRLQSEVHNILRETTFGNPVKVSVPGGKTLVYRRRESEGRPDPVAYEENRSEARKAQHKRSQAQVEAWNKFSNPRQKSIVDNGVNPKRMRLMASNEEYERALMEHFPLAYELVEYVQGGGNVGNVSRITQLKPPVIHGIEDIADSVDWHLLSKGINAEHIETALSKDGKNVLLFMDDRAKPRLPQIKEILNKFGAPRILQKADDMSETTNQPHGFYVFELAPDEAMYQPSEKPASPEDGDWENDEQPRDMGDSLVDEYFELMESVYEPHCSTCGHFVFETDDPAEMKAKVELGKKAKKLDKKGVPKPAGNGTTFNMESDDEEDVEEAYGKIHPKMKKAMGSHKSFEARVGDPSGKKKKLHPSQLGDDLDVDCPNCGTDATEVNEHEFNGYYCARHGERLDKYSKACYECQGEREVRESLHVACPDCHSETTLESADCGVCGTVFTEDEVVDFAGYLADAVLPDTLDDTFVETEQDWGNGYATELADSLFADVDEDNPLPF